MSAPAIPENEAERLAALQALHILDTAPEDRFDRLTRLACKMFDVPIALVSLVDSNRVWFKSNQGLDATECARETSFCGHAINAPTTMVIEDTLQDERFRDHPLVTRPPGLRFYAGHPIELEGGLRLGTLCLFDDKPRAFDIADRTLIEDLAAMAENELAAIHAASTDDLTRIANRRGFMTLANHSLKLCSRIGEPASLVVFDLDNFKAINEQFGHRAGDQALATFAGILQEVFRESDVIGRIGGDEFAALLTGDDHHDVDTSLRRFASAVEEYNSGAPAGYELQYSEGHLTHPATSDESLAELLGRADDLMSEIKRGKTGQADQTATA